MKTIIVYGTKYGCTEKCAKALNDKLNDEVYLSNLKVINDHDLAQYDKVIIGGSIYMGKIRKEVTNFCLDNLNTLKDKKVGLFICCMRDGDLAESELKDSFPKELVSNAIVTDYFGGEFIFKKMNFMERLIVKKVVKIDEDTSNIDDERITNFAQVMNNI